MLAFYRARGQDISGTSVRMVINGSARSGIIIKDIQKIREKREKKRKKRKKKKKEKKE